jgi:uncharacterized membrane protein YedE/YeeE
MTIHQPLKQVISSTVAGMLFGAGLVTAQMSDPLKVQAFLDVAGLWDPSLALVMAAALAVFGLGFAALRRWPRPCFDSQFHWPALTRVDARLLAGSALFGVGWGMTGYCPGPAIASVLSGNAEVWWFVPAMLAGGLLERWRRR